MNAIATIEPYPVIAVGTIARNPVLPPEPCVKNGTKVEPSQAPLTNAITTYAIIVSARPNTNKLLTFPARANFMLLRTRIRMIDPIANGICNFPKIGNPTLKYVPT